MFRITNRLDRRAVGFMHVVLMAANASGIMQETKVGKEMILIVIKGCQDAFKYIC